MESRIGDAGNALTEFALKENEQAVVLALDEVHGSFSPLLNAPGETVFHCLRRTLSSLKDNCYIMTFLLSTAGKVHQYAPPRRTDPSNRIRLVGHTLLPAFTSLGFDLLARGLVKRNKQLIKEMVTDEWMCRLGRPLYVP